jgi:Tol biopolymer transport system component
MTMARLRRCHRRIGRAGVVLAMVALGAVVARAQAPYQIQQISRNTQPGWGKVYASASAGGKYVALFSNADLAPGSPGNADGSWEVFRWMSDGSYVQVTSGAHERPPSLRVGTSAASISEDGHRIAFAAIGDYVTGRNADGSREIFLWEEGDGILQITDSTGDMDLGSHHPWISGDGRRIVFASDMHGRQPGTGPYQDAQSDIYLWEEGVGVQRITTVASPQSRAWMPRLSRDGQHIAFYCNADLVPGGNQDAGPEVYLWTEGQGLQQLTSHAGGKSMGLWAAPAVSADGSVVAFDTDADLTPGAPGNADGSTEVFLWRRNGGLRQITNLPGSISARSPALSADGSMLAFVSTGDLRPGTPGNPDGALELFTRSFDGTLRQLTRGASSGGIALPILSSGAELVTFLSDRDLAVGNQVLTPQTFVIRLSTPPATPVGPTPLVPQVCPQIANRVPAVVQAAAVASPERIGGWGVPLNPALPPSPANPIRRWLSVLDYGKPYSPANPVVWKAGCP